MNFDVVMKASAAAISTTSTTTVYRTDIGGEGSGSVNAGAGSDVNITTNPATDLNVFTHYAVTETDQRDLIAGNIELSTEYIAPTGAFVTAELDYQTQAGSAVDLTVEYTPNTGDTLHAILSDTVEISVTDDFFLIFNAGTPGETSITVDFGGPGHYDLQYIAEKINESYNNNVIAGGNLDLSAETDQSATATIQITLENNTSDSYTLTFGDSATSTLVDRLGFSGVTLSVAADPVLGNPATDPDSNVDKAIDYSTQTYRYKANVHGSGPTLADIVADLDFKLDSAGFSVEWIPTSVGIDETGHIEIKKTSGYAILTIPAVSIPGQLEYDLGLSGTILATAIDPSDTILKGDEILTKMNATTVDIGGMSLKETAEKLQSVLNDLNTSYLLSGKGLLASNTVGRTYGDTATLNSLEITNSSIYSITFSDNTTYQAISELFGTSSKLVDRGGSPTATATGNSVYTGKTITSYLTDANMNMTDIADKLNDDMHIFLGGDDLSGNNNFNFFEYDSVNDTITLKNDTVSGYKIKITDDSNPLNIGGEMWNVGELARAAVTETGNVPSGAIGVGTPLVLGIAGMDIYEAFLYIKSTLLSTPELSGLTVDWVTDSPYDTPSSTHGELKLMNATGLQIKIKQLGIDQVDTPNWDTLNAKRWLFDGGSEFTIATGATGTKDSRSLQARDRAQVTINWEGNRANGTELSSGKAGVTAWVWEGSDLKDISLASVKYAVSSTEIEKLFDGADAAFYIEETTPSGTPTTAPTPDGTQINRLFSEMAINDSWILFTNAAVAGSADTLEIDLYDGGVFAVAANKDGISEDIKYNFNADALDNKTALINQMVRSGKGALQYETLTHSIEFKTVADATFQYGQRANAGDVGQWAMGSGVNAWYGQAYYGGDTTYYFQSGAAPSSIVKNIEVDRQNDINATLLFTYDGTSLTVEMKGYDRTNASTQLPGSHTFTSLEMISAQNGNSLSLSMDDGTVIDFTKFHVDISALAAGDKFVVNVAAAAKLDTVNTDPSIADDFISNVNIAIDGDPLRQNSSEWGSTMQYRFKDGVVDGKTLHLLGYAIDPVIGNSDAQGVGWYGGELDLEDFDAGGYASNSGVGTPGGTDSLAYWIRAEVNNQGETTPVASALVTSVYFQKMENDKTKSVKDFVAAIGYSDYSYGTRSDSSYGPMDETGDEEYNPYNASLIFDVLEAAPGVLKFRVQGHVMDLNGNYWYAEEEEFLLSTGANTSKDSTATPPLSPTEVLDPVVLFEDSAFGGLFFDEFTLDGAGLWTAGDRFTLSLTASGMEFGNIDELTLFSDRRGTNMPHSFRFNEGVLDNASTDLRIYQLANNISNQDSFNFTKDQVMDGTLSLSFGEYFPSVTGGDPNVRTVAEFGTVYKEGIDAGVAHFYSKTRDVAQFWDKNGRFLLDNAPEILTIRQGDRGTSVAIGAGMELGYLARAISEQIVRSLLVAPTGGGQLVSGDDKYDIFEFVNTVPGKSDKESVVGTFLAHSVLPGEDSVLKFYGSEDLMKAFGFNTIQRAEDNLFDLTVSDAHTGKVVSSMRKARAGELAYGLIAPSLALDVNAVIGVKKAVYDRYSGTFRAEVQSSFDQFIHLADSALRLQIGANEGENTILVLGDMTADGLGVKGLDVRGRETASRGITIIDNAIDKVSTQRAMVGSQINRLEHTISNLTVAEENLTASESRILDADMAREMMNFTKLQIMLQAGVSMLAQANALPQSVLSLLK